MMYNMSLFFQFQFFGPHNLGCYTEFHEDKTKLWIFYQWSVFERVPFFPQTLNVCALNVESIVWKERLSAIVD